MKRQTYVALHSLAVVVMLGGAALLIADITHEAISIPLIAVGVALSVLVENRRGRIPPAGPLRPQRPDL